MQIHRRTEPTPELPLPAREILVDDWMAGINEQLATYGVESCSVVALYEPKSRLGYLGHFTIGVSKDDFVRFDEMVEDARGAINGDTFHAWVGGSTLLTPEIKPEVDPEEVRVYNEIIGMNRQHILQQLGTLSLAEGKRGRRDWLGRNQRLDAVVMDQERGHLEFWPAPLMNHANG